MKKLYSVSLMIKELGTTNKMKIRGKKLSERAVATMSKAMIGQLIDDPTYQNYEDMKEAFSQPTVMNKVQK